MNSTLMDDVARSIDSTLHAVSRRNELHMAWVRVYLMVPICLLELLFLAIEPEVPLSGRLPSFVYLGLCLVLLWGLRAGHYARWLAVVVPIADGLFLYSRFTATFDGLTHQRLLQGQELSIVGLISALVILTGAFRLRRIAVWSTSAIGMLLYLLFAIRIGLTFAQLAVHLTLIASMSAMAFGVTHQVRNAMRSEVARQTLTRFLPSAVVDGAHDDPMGLLTRPRAVEATVLVSDIRGFTAWAADKSPLEVLRFLNLVQGTLARIVRAHHGTVDKFMGDGMLAVFGAPEDLADHAEHALAAAKAMQRALDRLRGEMDEVDVRLGIGLHSGELVVGCLGSGVRLEFTVLGDTVNTSSRLETLTKELGVSVLISAATRERLRDAGGLVSLGAHAVRGHPEPIEVWTVE